MRMMKTIQDIGRWHLGVSSVSPDQLASVDWRTAKSWLLNDWEAANLFTEFRRGFSTCSTVLSNWWFCLENPRTSSVAIWWWNQKSRWAIPLNYLFNPDYHIWQYIWYTYTPTTYGMACRTPPKKNSQLALEMMWREVFRYIPVGWGGP